jgi:hypothetical protein
MVPLVHHLTIRERIISSVVQVGVMQLLVVAHRVVEATPRSVLVGNIVMRMFLAIPMGPLICLHNQYHLYQSIVEHRSLMQPSNVGNLVETIVIAASIRRVFLT